MTAVKGSRFPWPDPVLRATARLLVHRVGGRFVGALLFGLPALVFVWTGTARGWTVIDLWLWPLLIVPASLTAFLMHECGHMTVLWLLGVPSRLYWRLPVDMRTIPLQNRPEDSTSVNRIRRGLGGWLANAFCVLTGLLLTLAYGNPLWAFLALPHGFAALSATAWVVHVSNQDAATLAGALTLSDSVSMEWRAAPHVLHLTGWVWDPGESYWMIVEGLQRAEVEPGSGWLALDLDENRVFLARRHSGSGTFSFAVHGELFDVGVSLLTASGTRATVSVPKEREGPP